MSLMTWTRTRLSNRSRGRSGTSSSAGSQWPSVLAAPPSSCQSTGSRAARPDAARRARPAAVPSGSCRRRRGPCGRSPRCCRRARARAAGRRARRCRRGRAAARSRPAHRAVRRTRERVADVAARDEPERAVRLARHVGEEPRCLDREERTARLDVDVLAAAVLVPAPARLLDARRMHVEVAVVHVDVPAEQRLHERQHGRVVDERDEALVEP